MTKQKKSQIVMYGTTWCGDCKRSKVFLDGKNIGYNFIDIEDEKNNPGAAEKVMKINNGMRSVPTIVFPDKSVLVEPSNEQLKEKLADLGF